MEKDPQSGVKVSRKNRKQGIVASRISVFESSQAAEQDQFQQNTLDRNQHKSGKDAQTAEPQAAADQLDSSPDTGFNLNVCTLSASNLYSNEPTAATAEQNKTHQDNKRRSPPHPRETPTQRPLPVPGDRNFLIARTLQSFPAAIDEEDPGYYTVEPSEASDADSSSICTEDMVLDTESFLFDPYAQEERICQLQLEMAEQSNNNYERMKKIVRERLDTLQIAKKRDRKYRSLKKKYKELKQKQTNSEAHSSGGKTFKNPLMDKLQKATYEMENKMSNISEVATFLFTQEVLSKNDWDRIDTLSRQEQAKLILSKVLSQGPQEVLVLRAALLNTKQDALANLLAPNNGEQFVY